MQTIFAEKLGPNKVTHPFENNGPFFEGYEPSISSVKATPSPANATPSSVNASVNATPSPAKATPSPAKATPSPAKATPSTLMSTLMLWRLPETTLLSEIRQNEELRKFKDDLCKAFLLTSKKKEDVTKYILDDVFDKELFEFLGHHWNVMFITEHGVHGPLHPIGYWIDSHPPYAMCEKNLDDYRKCVLNMQNLKTVKDYKDVFNRLKLPVTVVDESTGKRRAMLKGELHAYLTQKMIENT